MTLPTLDLSSIVAGAFLCSVLSYAVRTMPPISNPWGAWLVDIARYVFANPDKVQSLFKYSSPPSLK